MNAAFTYPAVQVKRQSMSEKLLARFRVHIPMEDAPQRVYPRVAAVAHRSMQKTQRRLLRHFSLTLMIHFHVKSPIRPPPTAETKQRLGKAVVTGNELSGLVSLGRLGRHWALQRKQQSNRHRESVYARGPRAEQGLDNNCIRKRRGCRRIRPSAAAVSEIQLCSATLKGAWSAWDR